MKKTDLVVLLDFGHTDKTQGKCSPDKSFREYKSNREIGGIIMAKLKNLGIEYYNVHPELGWTDAKHTTDSSDLVVRTNRINAKYAEIKAAGKQAIMISIHSNAAGNNTGWTNARGFIPYIANNASAKSKKLAELLYDECIKYKLQGNRAMGSKKYLTADFWVIRKTNCPCVLTENLFYTNKEDLKYLQSEEGKANIAQMHINAILKYIEQV